MRIPLVHDTFASLHLRPLRPEDATGLHRAVTQPDIGRMLSGFPASWTLADAQALIERRARDAAFAIDAGDSTFWGLIALSERDPEQVSFFLVPEAQGQGIMQLALKGFLTHILAATDLPEIRAEVYHDNPASMALLRGAGFVETGYRDSRCSPQRCGAERLHLFCLSRRQKTA